MPRVKRKTKARTAKIPSGAVHHLTVGRDFFRSGFGDNLDAMRAAWTENPHLREQVHAEARRRGRLRPAAWWMFESPQRRDKRLSEREQLERLGLLMDDDVSASL